MNKAEIEAVLQMYFDSSYELDKQKARDAFHPDAHIHLMRDDGAPGDLTVDAFVGIFDKMKSPESVGQEREDKILSIDFGGENTAVARVELRIGQTRFTDILCLVQLYGQWQIITKVASGVSV